MHELRKNRSLRRESNLSILVLLCCILSVVIGVILGRFISLTHEESPPKTITLTFHQQSMKSHNPDKLKLSLILIVVVVIFLSWQCGITKEYDEGSMSKCKVCGVEEDELGHY